MDRFLIWFFLILFSTGTMAAQIDNVRIWPEPSKTRIVLDLSAPTSFKHFTLDNPDRLVIDIPAGKFSADLSKTLWPSPVTKFRYAQHDVSTLRLVIDLRNKINPQVFTLAANGPYGDRLVIDLVNIASAPNAPAPVITAAAASTTQPATPRIPEKAAKKAFIVAIDAGHGGEDPGAIGPSGTH
jgi:N-acetylmuramoyl-L-alanine amidase